jgi:BMFP domain-containing protein YqiC
MQKNSTFFEGLASFASSAAGSAMDMRRELESYIAEKLSHLLKDHQFVTREEFEIVRGMAEKARAENEALRKEIDQLKTKA